MSWDGGGNFSRVHNWVNDAAADIDITASRVDAEDDNLATGIGACLTKNGETKPTANFSPTTTRTYDLGTTSLRWRTAYIGTGLNIQSGTAAAATTFAFTDATSARTITFPDATGTVSLLGVDETISGIKTFTGACTFTHTGAGTAPITIQSTEAGAATGPLLYLDRSSASPAASDYIGRFIFSGRDSAGNVTHYAGIYAYLDDPTNGSEDGTFIIYNIVAGTETTQVSVKNGTALGSPTGSFKGTGTLNATALYENGVRVGVGAGQTWQDVSGSRSVSTTYTNSTGKPIQVNIVAAHNNTLTPLNLIIGGVTVASVSNQSGGVSQAMSMSGIVPDGTDYSVTGQGLSTWLELRA